MERPGPDSPAFWSERYRTNETRWDLGTVSPPFVQWLAAANVSPGRLAIPGCGYGHEAIFFAQHGFTVTGFDLAPEACASLSQSAADKGLHIEVVQGDALAPAERFAGQFDYVLEQSFFCAIPPRRRPEYMANMHRLLKAGGLLFGLYLKEDDPDGPPYGTSLDELRRLTAGRFAERVLERCRHSHPRRQGREWWAEWVALG